MAESTETPLGPAIKTETGETKYPFQELKESLGGKKFETLIVFGQGPVKPVLTPEELDEKQKVLWEKFKKDPLHLKEPDFRVIEPPEEPAKNGQYLDLYSSLKAVDERDDLTYEQKKAEKERIRSQWQFSGRFALNRWGRENALAAGLALYLGITDKLILSGGRTIPDWYKKKLKSDFLKNFETDSSLSPDELDRRFNLWFNTHWPSEAQLMKDIIVRRFGKMYQERYGRSIEEAIQLEDQSTNTLLNFANSINRDPSLISSEGKAGFLATDFHIRRCLFLAKLFSVIEKSPENLATEAQKLLTELDQVFSVEGPIIKAQSILNERAIRRNKETYQQIQEWLLNLDENPDLKQRVLGEMRWTRGLTDPQFLEYFAQYFGEFYKPETIKPLQNFLWLLRQPGWQENARRVFESVGLNFDEFSPETLSNLMKDSPKKFQDLIAKLKSIERRLPPEEK